MCIRDSGDVTKVNAELLQTLLDVDLVPVISSLGANANGRIFNINADTTAVAIAKAMNVDLLILSTMVGGIFNDINDPDSRIAEVSRNSAKKLIKDRIINDGMIPKVQEALALLDQGVDSIVIANPIIKGAFLDIVKQKGGYGTRLVL